MALKGSSRTGDIAVAVRTARKERGLTQLQLSALCGLGATAISQSERGMVHLQGRMVAQVLKALGLTVEEER